MPVELEIYGQLADKLPRRQMIELEKGITVKEMLLRLGLQKAEIGMMVINGKQVKMNDPIPENCRLCFFPPLEGG